MTYVDDLAKVCRVESVYATALTTVGACFFSVGSVCYGSSSTTSHNGKNRTKIIQIAICPTRAYTKQSVVFVDPPPISRADEAVGFL